MRLSHTLLCSIVLYILLILLPLPAGLLSHSMQQILYINVQGETKNVS